MSLTKNSKDLTIILNKKICPKCHHKIQNIDFDKKSGGCSGTENLTFLCPHCSYSNSFNLPSNGCGTGSSCSSNKCKI